MVSPLAAQGGWGGVGGKARIQLVSPELQRKVRRMLTHRHGAEQGQRVGEPVLRPVAFQQQDELQHPPGGVHRQQHIAIAPKRAQHSVQELPDGGSEGEGDEEWQSIS